MNNFDKQTIQSKVFLENRNKFSVTGISRVITANENKIYAIVSKTNMTILGSGLKVNKLDIESGVLEGDGTVDSIKYGKTKSIFGKLFK